MCVLAKGEETGVFKATSSNDDDDSDDDSDNDKLGVLLYCNTKQVCRVLNFH